MSALALAVVLGVAGAVGEEQPVLTSHGYSADKNAAATLLAHCHGDCDRDGHCGAGLVCHQNHHKDPIPGCAGTPNEGMDYCVREASPPCSAAEYEKSPPTATRPRQCAPLTTCKEGEWEASPPTLIYAEAGEGRAGAKIISAADRVCRALTTCRRGEWETVAAGPRNDRACAAHTRCAADGSTREAWHAGTHHDRECAVGQVCSHVTCTHEEHDCPTHRAYRRQRSFVQKNLCDLAAANANYTASPWMKWAAPGAADGQLSLPLSSIRVWHHGAETTCRRGAHCAMRASGGGAQKCVCTQRFPSRPDAASCEQQTTIAAAAAAATAAAAPAPALESYRRKAACFRHCRATGEAAACTAAAGFVDTQPPVITSCGTPTEYVNRWSQWELCRATAVDGIDGDVTSAIRYDVTGPPKDHHRAVRLLTAAKLNQVVWLLRHERHVGRYELAMRVCDASDNCASARQHIEVHEVTSRLSCRHLRPPVAFFTDNVDSDVCSASFCADASAGKRKTFAYAREYCRRQGARLCTSLELRRCGARCGSGCAHENEPVWTSSTLGCNRGAHVLDLGLPRADRAKECRDDSESVGALRCCADRYGFARFFVFYKGWNIVPQGGAHAY